MKFTSKSDSENDGISILFISFWNEYDWFVNWHFYALLWIPIRVTEEKPGWCTDPLLPPCAAYEQLLLLLLLLLFSALVLSVTLSDGVVNSLRILFPCECRFVEIMAPVFSRDAWRCAWHMIQVRNHCANVVNYHLLELFLSFLSFPPCHVAAKSYCLSLYCRMTWSMGGVLTLLLENVWMWVICFHPMIYFFLYFFCFLLALSWWNAFKILFSWKQPAHEKIGVVDSQWIVHQTVPSLGNQVKGYIGLSQFLLFFPSV